MIEHLRGRDRKLEPLGWTGQHAEWITLVCLHSGVFTWAQFCHYFNAQRMTASRFVNALVDRRIAVEGEWPLFNGGGKTCRISSNAIFRALGVENIRQRRRASKSVIMRRLLSLDFVLEHPGMNWLPAEAEKVEFFEKLGLPRTVALLRPPPGRRTRPSGVDETACFNSAIPFRINGRDTPVAVETAEIPPRPMAALSAATSSRRDRSSSLAARALNRNLIPARSAIPLSIHQNIS